MPAANTKNPSTNPTTKPEIAEFLKITKEDLEHWNWIEVEISGLNSGLFILMESFKSAWAGITALNIFYD